MMQGTQNSALGSVGLQCLLFLRQNCFPQEKTKSTTRLGTEGQDVCMKENECIAPDYGEWRCCVQREVVWCFYFTKNNIIILISQVT